MAFTAELVHAQCVSLDIQGVQKKKRYPKNMLPISQKSRYNPINFAMYSQIVSNCRVKFSQKKFHFNGFYNGFCQEHVFGAFFTKKNVIKTVKIKMYWKNFDTTIWHYLAIPCHFFFILYLYFWPTEDGKKSWKDACKKTLPKKHASNRSKITTHS